jgi:hypothetical protein
MERYKRREGMRERKLKRIGQFSENFDLNMNSSISIFRDCIGYLDEIDRWIMALFIHSFFLSVLGIELRALHM